MASQTPLTPVTGFDCDAKGSSSGWTRSYVKSAFPNDRHEDIVKRLFARATELVQEHNLRASAFKGQNHPKLALEKRRGEIASLLENERGPSIQISGFPSFAGRLCKGVLTYQGGPGSTLDCRILLEAGPRRYATVYTKDSTCST